ncbi:MAG: glucose-6-phosphate isomerase [Campylobacterales bacterium]|nr:glucose-6-phosphate isomerase [Campylobacterales bacterium]
MQRRYNTQQICFEQEFSLDGLDEALQQQAFEVMQEERQSGRIGYYDLPRNSAQMVYDAASRLHKLESKFSKSIQTIVVIGIGGSSLGIKAIDTLLHPALREQKEIVYLENSDPVELSYALERIHKGRSLFFLISKSGGTIETISIFKMMLTHFNIHLDGADKERFFIITDEGSILSQFAKQYGLNEFNIPENVGGRFSVLSAVGVLPLLAAGFNVPKILDGASSMIERFFAGQEMHVLQKAAFMTTHKEHYPINVLFGYSNLFEQLGKWFVQLWAESLGKVDAQGNRVGLTPIGLTGAVDQHSFLQLIIEGPRNKTVTFMKIDNFENGLMIPDISLKFLEKTNFANSLPFNTLINAQCDATKESLLQCDVPVDTITLARIDEETVGAILAYFELLTSAAGAMMHINTYDQPGVELGKVILQKRFAK